MASPSSPPRLLHPSQANLIFSFVAHPSHNVAMVPPCVFSTSRHAQSFILQSFTHGDSQDPKHLHHCILLSRATFYVFLRLVLVVASEHCCYASKVSHQCRCFKLPVATVPPRCISAVLDVLTFHCDNGRAFSMTLYPLHFRATVLHHCCLSIPYVISEQVPSSNMSLLLLRCFHPPALLAFPQHTRPHARISAPYRHDRLSADNLAMVVRATRITFRLHLLPPGSCSESLHDGE